jgi:hypothetical protein
MSKTLYIIQCCFIWGIFEHLKDVTNTPQVKQYSIFMKRMWQYTYMCHMTLCVRTILPVWIVAMFRQSCALSEIAQLSYRTIQCYLFGSSKMIHLLVEPSPISIWYAVFTKRWIFLKVLYSRSHNIMRRNIVQSHDLALYNIFFSQMNCK